jgi:hypothetical protein
MKHIARLLLALAVIFATPALAREQISLNDNWLFIKADMPEEERRLSRRKLASHHPAAYLQCR